MQGTSQLGTECFLLHGAMCRASQTKMNHEQMIFFSLTESSGEKQNCKIPKDFSHRTNRGKYIRVLFSRRLLMDCRNFCWLTAWLFSSSGLGRCSPSVPGSQELVLPAIMRPAGEQSVRILVSALPLAVQRKPFLPVTCPVDTRLKSNLLENN